MTEATDLTCRELIEFLMEYVDGELPPTQRSAFDRHLAVCPSCVAYLSGYRLTISMGKSALGATDEPVRGVPEPLVHAILKARDSNAHGPGHQHQDPSDGHATHGV